MAAMVTTGCLKRYMPELQYLGSDFNSSHKIRMVYAAIFSGDGRYIKLKS